MHRTPALIALATLLVAGCQGQDTTPGDDAGADPTPDGDAAAEDMLQDDPPAADTDGADTGADTDEPDLPADVLEEDAGGDAVDRCRSGLSYPPGPYLTRLPDSQYTAVPEPLIDYSFEGYFDDDGDGEITDETWRTISMEEMLNSCFKHLLIMIATPDCPYCAEELGELRTMYSTLRDSGFLVLVLVADRPHDPTQEYVDAYVAYHGLNMPVGVDAGRDIISIFPHGFSAMTPKNILIDLETMRVGQCCQDGDPGTPGRVHCWLEGFSRLMLACIEREHLAWDGGG